MRLVRFSVEGVDLFEHKTVELDFHAADRVYPGKPFAHRLTDGGSTASILTVNGIYGLNATGKTTALRLTALATELVNGNALGLFASQHHSLLGMLDEHIRFRAVCEEKGIWFFLDSMLSNDGETLSFEREILAQFAGAVQKRQLSSMELAEQGPLTLVATRNVGTPGHDGEVSEETLRYLPNDVSIIRAQATDSVPTAVLIDADQQRFRLSTYPEVLQVFDQNLEYLHVDRESHVHLKFVDERDERIVTVREMRSILSAGTVRGMDIIQAAIVVLNEGGYLLVDELENSLNKQLVRVIMNLFASPDANPYGATLVFTTHYPELLDLIDRKDCVWITLRDQSQNGKMVRYSDRVTRIENKKSEVIFSNFIKGTAPKAAQVEALTRLVKGLVRDGR